MEWQMGIQQMRGTQCWEGCKRRRAEIWAGSASERPGGANSKAHTGTGPRARGATGRAPPRSRPGEASI